MRHVVGAMDPQGLHQVGFKKPTAEELQHDFLWRIRQHTPRHGEIAVFDRSHYEDVLVHRVEELTPPSRLERRYGSIRQFEKDLAGNGTHVIKVFLHLGKDEQYERLSARLAVQQLLIECLAALQLEWPPASFDVEEQRRRLDATR